MMLPKLSAPLAKSIRTGEGILVYAANIALGLLAALPHGLPWEQSVLFATITNGVFLISRTILKLAAVNAGLGIAPPIAVNPVDPATVEAVVRQILTLAPTTDPAPAEPAVPFIPPPAPPVAAPPVVLP